MKKTLMLLAPVCLLAFAGEKGTLSRVCGVASDEEMAVVVATSIRPLLTAQLPIVATIAFAALLAGIALKNVVPKKILDFIDAEIRAMAYGFFTPIFFLSVGCC